jgi:hypothetical protein
MLTGGHQTLCVGGLQPGGTQGRRVGEETLSKGLLKEQKKNV